jgi:uncharacterized protein YbjQ (UPF0145 family)
MVAPPAGSGNVIPNSATQRLRAGIFTSDLSVDELVCLEDIGIEPLGFVLGSSIYHVGLQVSQYGQNMELDVLSQAMYTARSLAITRMEAEADALQADGIVGVRFTISQYEWGADLLEVLAVGTAVRTRDRGAHMRPQHGRPFSSDLSGQDFWKLVQAGYRPVRLAMGTCVYHVAHQTFRQVWGKAFRNAEMENFTQATYEARELAMGRMEGEAQQAGGAGIVGVRILERSWGWGSHIIEFFAIGTSVVRVEAPRRALTPTLVLPLNGH